MTQPRSIIKNLDNIHVANIGRLLLHTYARSGLPAGIIFNVLAFSGVASIGAYCLYRNISGALHVRSRTDWYLLSTGLFSSALSFGFMYFTPVSLVSLAQLLVLDTVFRGVMSTVCDVRIIEKTYNTRLGNIVNRDGLGKGLIDATIFASSVLALLHATPLALPLALGCHILKAAAFCYDLTNSEVDKDKYKKHREYRETVRLCQNDKINQIVAQAARIGVLTAFMAASPVPSFAVAALFFIADGFCKVAADAFTQSKMAIVPQMIPTVSLANN